MSTLQVANLHFESTANNRIQNINSTAFAIVAGGTTAATINATALSVNGVFTVDGNRVPSPASQAQGDILYRGATTWERLAAGTSGLFLKTLGAGSAPAWDQPGGITLLGTIDTTSGAAGTGKSLTGLTLTNYKQLYVTWNEVSLSTSDTLRFSDGTTNYVIDSAGGQFPLLTAVLNINLDNGIFLLFGQWVNSGTYPSQNNFTQSGSGSTGLKILTGRGRWTTSTTEFNISAGGTSNFDSGNVKVYGVA